MRDPDEMFIEPQEDIDYSTDPMLKKHFNQTNTWAKYHGFQYTKHINVSSKANGKIINCTFWTNETNTLALGMYYVDETVHFDFASKFENERSLTTSSSKDGAILPTPPGNFAQFFPELTLNETWQYHTEAEKFIEKKFKCSPISFQENIIEEVKEATKKQQRFIASLFLWQLRGPYWFFVRRNIIANKKIAERFA